MIKPEPQTITAYNYNECEKYINDKYNIKTRNYAGKTWDELGRNVPYQDFWHWIIENNEIHNGCYFWLSRDQEDMCEDWQKEILNLFLKEFGDESQEIYFYVSW